MTDETASAGANPPSAPLSVLAQSIQDLSVESPGAPETLLPGQPAPNISVAVDVNARVLDQERRVFEVILRIKADAKSGENDEKTVFIVELSYGGVVVVADSVPEEHMPSVVMIEGPRLLFPFARAIVSDATRDAGFAPLLIPPVDFVELLRRKAAAA